MITVLGNNHSSARQFTNNSNCDVQSCCGLQEVAVHGDEIRRMEGSNKTLKQEIKQLSTDLSTNVRRTMFPELFNVPTGRSGPVFVSHFHQTAAVTIIIAAIYLVQRPCSHQYCQRSARLRPLPACVGVKVAMPVYVDVFSQVPDIAVRQPLPL